MRLTSDYIIHHYMLLLCKTVAYCNILYRETTRLFFSSKNRLDAFGYVGQHYFWGFAQHTSGQIINHLSMRHVRLLRKCTSLRLRV
jgi:hypothetical protein